ncbi:hypothetical protein ACFXJO_16675 [Streptomyces lavendulae]|uniref:hypothetical protein n=1 Tax=Streptomyces lavendulae TaxID=1914 RepID=UPI00367811A3
MRPLIAADLLPLGSLLQARLEYQLVHGQAINFEGSDLIAVVRGAPGKLAFGMWDGDTLVAAFVLQHAAPEDRWTDQEHGEPSLLISLMHSRPRRPAQPEHEGYLRRVTLWLCDYAALLDVPPAWIRCTARTQRVAEHLEQCGWDLVRSQHYASQRPCYLLQCAPQRSAIGSLVLGEGEADATREPEGAP